METGSPSAAAEPAGRNRSAPTAPPRGTVRIVRRSRLVGSMLVGVVAVAALAAGTAVRPELRFTDETPDDLRAVASRAWSRFTEAFPRCTDRLGTVTVAVAWRLPDRARYEPGASLVLVRAPGTAANLEASLLHEFAHHAEHRCPVGTGFRRRFTHAAGLPPGTPWSGGEVWDRIPSERFAEAAVFLVLGEAPPHVLIPVRPAEVRAVGTWARGG
jgi:hypothetical protein